MTEIGAIFRLKSTSLDGGEEAPRSSPSKDSRRQMKGFRLVTTGHMINSSKTAPRTRPCDCGIPRTKPPRPGFRPPADQRVWRAQRAAAACETPTISELWFFPADFHKEAYHKELCGPGERAGRLLPFEFSDLIVNLTSRSGLSSSEYRM